MDRTEIAALNASMTERVLGMPAAPVPDRGYALRVLRTRGRRSGEPRSIPVGVIGHEGAEYVVSPNGTRDWVRNLRSAAECALVTSGETSERRAVTPDADEAAGAVVTYLRALDQPFALQAFPVSADTSTEDVAAHLDTIAVFRLDLA